MPPLPSDLRSHLERTVAARDTAETAAHASLIALAVARDAPFPAMPDAQRRLAALPPVTPTAKPAVSPVAGQIAGLNRHDLVPGSAAGGAAVTVAVLRSLLHAAGYQVLGAAFVVDAATANAGWIVTGCGIIPS